MSPFINSNMFLCMVGFLISAFWCLFCPLPIILLLFMAGYPTSISWCLFWSFNYHSLFFSSTNHSAPSPYHSAPLYGRIPNFCLLMFILLSTYHSAPSPYHSAPLYGRIPNFCLLMFILLSTYHSAPCTYHSAPSTYHSAPLYGRIPNFCLLTFILLFQAAELSYSVIILPKNGMFITWFC